MTNIITQAPKLGKMDYVPFDSNYHFDVTFDLADATYYVQERHQSDNGTSFYNYLGHAVSYTLPENADASAFDAWVKEDVRPVLLRIKRGYKSKYNGNNEVAVFTGRAAEAKEALASLFGDYVGQSRYIESRVPTLDEGEGLYEAGDWLDGAVAQTLTDHSITANSTDYELEVASIGINSDATGANVRLSGVYLWLKDQRDNLVSAAEDAADDANNSGV